MGGTAEKTADEEEKELRDAFRVNTFIYHERARYDKTHDPGCYKIFTTYCTVTKPIET